MAKDPAINWYFDNWDGGTKLMTRHQKGCYMDLLSAQFHCGHLTLENIKQILGSDFAQWETLKAKFEIDKEGKFFNGRTEHEILKRLNERNGKSEGGKVAMKKRWGNKNLNSTLNNNPNKILNKTLETEIETDIGNERIGGMGEKWDSKPIAQFDLSVQENNLTIEYIFRIKQKMLTAEAVNEFWKGFAVLNFNGEQYYQSRADCIMHFRRWLKDQKHETITRDNKQPTSTKPGTSEARIERAKNW